MQHGWSDWAVALFRSALAAPEIGVTPVFFPAGNATAVAAAGLRANSSMCGCRRGYATVTAGRCLGAVSKLARKPLVAS